MEKDIKLNFAIAKAIIINQLCIEANEDLKAHKLIYRHNLKFHANNVVKELERRIKEFDTAYEVAGEFMMYSQQRIEILIPILAGIRIDELSNLSSMILAYNKNPEGMTDFINQTIKQEENEQERNN